MRLISMIGVVSSIAAVFVGCGSGDGSGNGSGNDNGNGATMATAIDVASYPSTDLTEEQKYSLAYMWHEEKLAKEIYLELNKVHPTTQLENIATKSETVHIQLVEDIVASYDINITNLNNYEVSYSLSELSAMPVGVFAVPEIQNLYNILYDKGIKSRQDSLEVGCMVEVTDVDDLNKYIVIAGTNQLLVDTFNILRDGSYKHYWAFDKGLKNSGVSDGCCSLGTEYCHSEYPQN